MKQLSIGSRTIIWSLLSGLLAGALFAGMFKGSFIAGLGMFLSPLPIVMVGLSFGLLAALASGFVALLLIPVLAFGGGVLFYLIWDFIPSLLVLFLLLKHRTMNKKVVWYPVGYTLSWLSITTAVIALLTVVTIVVGFNEVVAEAVAAASANNAEAGKLAATLPAVSGDFNIEAGLKALLLKALATSLPPQVDAATLEAMIAKVVPLFMAVIAVTWFIRIALVVFVAEFILLKKEKALRPKPDYTEIYVQNWVLVLLLVGAVIGAFGTGNLSYISQNFAACMALPFCVLGLAKVHVWAKRTKYASIVLAVFYVLLSVSFIVGIGTLEALIVLAAIGLYEQLYRLYRTVARQKKERK